MRHLEILLHCAALALLVTGCGPGLDTGFDLDDLNPATLQGLRAWFRADDFVGRATDQSPVNGLLWRSRVGGTVTPQGSPSDAGWDADGGPRGTPFIRLFNASGREFHNSTYGFGTGLSGLTVFIVGAPGAAPASTGRILGISSSATFTPGADSYFEALYNPSSGNYVSRVAIAGQPDATPSFLTAGGGFWITSFVWSGEGTGFSSHDIRGSSTASTSTSSIYSGPQTLGINAYLFIGQSSLGGGDIAEILAYNRRLSSDEIAYVHQYLSKRYGL